MNRPLCIVPLLAFTCFACGAAPDETVGDPPVDATELAIDEPGCATAPGVNGAIFGFLGGQPRSVTSADGNYGTAECTHGYRVGALAIASTGPSHFEVKYAGPVTTPSFLGCSAMWVYATLYREDTSGNEWLSSGPITYGQEVRIDGGTRCGVPRLRFEPPAGERFNGVYRVVAQAGAIFSFQKVTVSFVSDGL